MSTRFRVVEVSKTPATASASYMPVYVTIPDPDGKVDSLINESSTPPTPPVEG